MRVMGPWRFLLESQINKELEIIQVKNANQVCGLHGAVKAYWEKSKLLLSTSMNFKNPFFSVTIHLL